MALYDPEGVRAFYNRYGEREWNRLETPFGRVQAWVTARFLERHLDALAQPGQVMRVLDVGCGPGRFALVPLRRACRVTLVDVSDAMLAEAQRRIADAGLTAGLEGVYRGSYLDTGFLAAEAFDAVLCLGGSLNYMPERVPEALAAFHRVLRPGGLLLGGVMNASGSLRAILAQGWKPADDRLSASDLQRVVETGVLEIDGRPISEHRARMFHLSEVRAALPAAGFSLLEASATECLLSLPADRLVELERDPAWPALLQAEADACRRAPETGAHLLFAAQRG